MFSFHKPKVYRSTAGCCICKAKSSSSRFTDSKKYETDFIQCFQLETPRRGEICNACVLLVKRFKRLPPGSNRHWGHVVDARTGPGLKSMTKFKKRKEEQEAGEKGTTTTSSVAERLSKLFKKGKKKEKSYKKETSSLGGSSDDSPPSPTESQHSDDYDETIFGKKFFNYATRANQKRQKVIAKQRMRRKNPRPTKNLQNRFPANHFNLFVDVINDDQWRQRETCCGIVYECAELQAIIVDASSFKPCIQHCSASSKRCDDEEQSENSMTTTKASDSNQPTAIKKHQLFLKRHEQPSPSGVVTATTSSEHVISSCSVMESSNRNKTELMETDELMKPFDKLRRLNDIKMGLPDEVATETVINENAFESKKDSNNHNGGVKLLHKLNSESVKISKPSTLFNNPLSASLKFKLANIVKCGTLGNDNSSDSGYEEVQDGSKLMIAQMPPPDVMQSL
ncbi:CLUMA_CG008700, isoform A [Clunio marinus]|uniref:CLUMA_CG008700, isoform A n=1 Tax=Clunio marinus TaxID=568069 RepID=A0A1J1I540_9DIPT|nr:CLUMA_CG008700, isoform A [Clunio marinus]